MKLLGLMSGTSMDGVDAALLEVEGESEDVRAELVAFRCAPFEDRRGRIRQAIEDGSARELCLLHARLGEWLADAALALLQEAGVAPRDVRAIGSHGHTVWHLPPTEVERVGRGATLQLGDPATIAARTGIPVVSDFRAADVAAGGHGAPLVPFADRILFSRPGAARALQNLGGIGNVTWLAPKEGRSEPVAFDTGPGNVLLDLTAERATSGRQTFDGDGRIAERGAPDEALVDRLLRHPFFAEEPPRSTGRETFGPALVEQLVSERGLTDGDDAGWADLMATLVRFTARTIGESYRRWVLPLGVDEVVLTGGGARNPVLAGAIEEELTGVPVRTGAAALGMDPDAREAAAFAVLAWAHLEGLPANVPSVTGASGPRVLGSLTPAPTGGGASG